jgi:hypothetical protein
MTKPVIAPGDVLVVRTEGITAGLIRFGAAWRDLPNLENHVAIAHHVNQGVWRGIEARPGGVGWVDLEDYLESRYTLTNYRQPKTEGQRSTVCSIMEQMLKTGYDWDAIAQDALYDLHIPDVWAERWHGQTPDHVVCSSLAAWGYHGAHLAAPATEDMAHIQPANWTEFILVNGYQ